MTEPFKDTAPIRKGEELNAEVNVPPDDLVQYTGAIGAAVLAHRRLAKLREEGRLEERLGNRVEAPRVAA